MAANGRPGRWLGERRRVTAWRILRSGDLAGLVRRTVAFLGRLGHRPTPVDYDGWRRQWVEVDEAARARVDELVAALPRRPSFTVLVPVDGADEALIAATVGSVADQRYPNWVLCLTGTDSPDPTVADLMAEVGDKRVRFTGPSPTPSGEWVTRLLPGDLVHEVALFAVADAVNRNPSAALVYTDHDHVGPDGRFVDPHMKPDLNLDLLAAMDYLKVLTVYRADLWATHATMSTGAHDLAVRATARLGDGQVEHVPHVLASLRVSDDGSHLVPSTLRVAYPLPDPPPRVSVLIPTRDRGRMLERCLLSLRDKTDYPNVELVIVDHETTEARARTILDGLAGKANTQVVTFSGPFNFAAMTNRAAEAATGEVLVFLNNDTEVINPSWLNELVAQVCRLEVGVAGALLLFGDGTIQHAGVHPGVNGLMGHGHKHLPRNHPGYFGRLLVAHEVAAVTGACLAIQAATFESLGGLDEEHLAVAYNDVDLCLKARQAGLRVLFTPHACLVHHESVSRGADDDPAHNDRLARELSIMQERWGDLLHLDPGYSPNLSLDGGGFELAEIPRDLPTWRR